MIRRLTVETRGHGLHEFTVAVQDAVRGANIAEGICTVFVQHTSASLVIQENADPTAKRDLEHWIERLVPEGDPFIPVVDGKLALGTWQGIYLWEHRRRGSRRDVVLHIAT